MPGDPTGATAAAAELLMPKLLDALPTDGPFQSQMRSKHEAYEERQRNKVPEIIQRRIDWRTGANLVSFDGPAETYESIETQAQKQKQKLQKQREIRRNNPDLSSSERQRLLSSSKSTRSILLATSESSKSEPVNPEKLPFGIPVGESHPSQLEHSVLRNATFCHAYSRYVRCLLIASQRSSSGDMRPPKPSLRNRHRMPSPRQLKVYGRSTAVLLASH